MVIVCEFVISKEFLGGKNWMKWHKVFDMMKWMSVIFDDSELEILYDETWKNRYIEVKLSEKILFCSYYAHIDESSAQKIIVSFVLVY